MIRSRGRVVGPPRHRATPTARGCGGVPADARVHVTSRLRLFPRRFLWGYEPGACSAGERTLTEEAGATNLRVSEPPWSFDP